MRKKKYFSFFTHLGEIFFTSATIGLLSWIFSTNTAHFLEIVGVAIVFWLIYKTFFDTTGFEEDAELEEATQEIIKILMEEENEENEYDIAQESNEEKDEQTEINQLIYEIRLLITIISAMVSLICCLVLIFSKQTKENTIFLIVIVFVLCILGYKCSLYEYQEEDYQNDDYE